MAPFIPDGVYKIRNVGFTGFVADLINGVPNGPISGYTEHDYNRNDRWNIVNSGGGGNQITLESVSVPGSFANADQFQGAQLLGSGVQTIWTVVKVDRGYYLQSPDANYVWELPDSGDCVPIVLVHHTAKDNTRWTFESLN